MTGEQAADAPKTVDIFTDGACSGNPGPGGWGAILRWGSVEKEMCGGEAGTTNNRMELMAAIQALEALKRPVKVRLHTDSQYLRDGITKWIHGWKDMGWVTADKKPVTGADAVGKAVPFTLKAPERLAGLPRHEVRLLDSHGHPAALVLYGRNLGGIVVIEERADQAASKPAAPKREGDGAGLSLPTVSINGVTGQELGTALGTIVRFTRGDVAFTIVGSVPPAAAEAAARDSGLN